MRRKRENEVRSFQKTSRPVAFISGRIGSTFVSSVVRGTEERVRAFGPNMYELNHYPSAGRKNGPGDAVREIISGRKADAMIILSVMPDDRALAMIKKSGIHAVFIERKVEGIHSVTIDNYAGGYAAGMQLADRGRRKLGVISDPQSLEPGMASEERLRGFKDAVKKAGIKLDPGNFTGVTYHSVEDGREAFDIASRRMKKIDGIFSAAGDLVAIGFMLEARASGIKVPDDLAIIGFDDVEMASAVEPALTTIRQPIQRMGGVAMEILHECFKGRLKTHKHIVLDSKLVVREST